MGMKFRWKAYVILGLLLSILSIPVDAYTMLIIERLIQLDLYFAWAISTIAPVTLIVVPAGFYLFEFRPAIHGALIGVVAVLVLIGWYGLEFGETPSKGFVIEYISLVTWSSAAAYLGYRAKLAINPHKV